MAPCTVETLDGSADPVRFRLIEAMARRAGRQQGAARAVLQARLATLVAAYGEQIPRDRPIAPPATTAHSPLAALTDTLARRAADRTPAHTVLAAPAGTAEPASLAYMRSTWSRLSAQRRLARSLEQLPENAGPLNSQRLVHRALNVMHEASPEYLRRFMAHAEVLMWLEQAQAATPTRDAPRGKRGRKASA